MKLRSPPTTIGAILACALCIFTARAADDPAGLHQTYHEHFAACAHQSKGLHGQEHHAFMSECLKDHGWQGAPKAEAQKTSAEATPQQHRMQSCNEEAGKRSLHGDERRAFMSTCLKG